MHTWTLIAFHSQSVGFNMELAHLLQPQVMREGFPRDLWVRLWGFFFQYSICEPRHWFWMMWPGSLNESHGCPIEWSSGLCRGPSCSSAPKPVVYVFMDLVRSFWIKKGSFAHCSLRGGNMKVSGISWDARFLSLEHQNGPFDCRAEAWIITLHHYSQSFSLPLVI